MVSKTGVERFENDCGSCENFKKIQQGIALKLKQSFEKYHFIFNKVVRMKLVKRGKK